MFQLTYSTSQLVPVMTAKYSAHSIKKEIDHVEHFEGVARLQFDTSIFEREVHLSFYLEIVVLTGLAESRLSKYIPGGYSPSRCLKLQGRPMMYAVLALAGCSIMFFGYDASVMSQVNTNSDYLRLMVADSGSDHDSAAVGGIISVWFGGFAIGMHVAIVIVRRCIDIHKVQYW